MVQNPLSRSRHRGGSGTDAGHRHSPQRTCTGHPCALLSAGHRRHRHARPHPDGQPPCQGRYLGRRILRPLCQRGGQRSRCLRPRHHESARQPQIHQPLPLRVVRGHQGQLHPQAGGGLPQGRRRLPALAPDRLPLPGRFHRRRQGRLGKEMGLHEQGRPQALDLRERHLPGHPPPPGLHHAPQGQPPAHQGQYCPEYAPRAGNRLPAGFPAVQAPGHLAAQPPEQPDGGVPVGHHRQLSLLRPPLHAGGRGGLLAGHARLGRTAAELVPPESGEIGLLLPDAGNLELYGRQPSLLQHQDALYRAGIFRKPVQQQHFIYRQLPRFHHAEHHSRPQCGGRDEALRRCRHPQERAYGQPQLLCVRQLLRQALPGPWRLYLQPRKPNGKRRRAKQHLDPGHPGGCAGDRREPGIGIVPLQEAYGLL